MSNDIRLFYINLEVKRKTEEESNAVNDGKNIILKHEKTDLETIIVNLQTFFRFSKAIGNFPIPLQTSI